MARTYTGRVGQRKALRELQNNLAKEIQGIQKRSLTGTNNAANYILMRTRPRVPRKTGKLVDSGVVTAEFVNGQPAAVVAFTAWYAGIQHNNMKFKHENGQAKFLQVTMDQEHQQILAKIAEEAKIR
jgi:hypothetical protein